MDGIADFARPEMAFPVETELVRPGIGEHLESLVRRGHGERIAWVQLPDGRRRPVDIDPKPLGEYALLRDGVRAISLREDARISDEFDRRYLGPRFWDHTKSCVLPSMAGADPAIKDARRKTLLEADRRRDTEYPGARD